MAVRKIVLMGDPILRTPAGEVTSFDEALQDLVADMFETMYGAEGIGLAAPQIGVSERVLVIDVRGEDVSEGKVALINPRIVHSSLETEKETEGCLSIPGLEEIVERPRSVEVHASDPGGAPVRLKADELFSRALQHEIDHLHGVLFLDRLSPLKRRILLKKWKKLRAEDAEETGSVARRR